MSSIAHQGGRTLPKFKQKWLRPKRVTAALHAAAHRVFTRPPTASELVRRRLSEQGLNPETCSCGGVRWTEPPVLINGLTVLTVPRCTKCKPAAEAC